MSTELQTPKRLSLKRILREKPFWLLVLMGFLYFHRPLFMGETFYFRDLFLHFFPQKHLLAGWVQAGELPLWDPYLYGGQPYLGNLSTSTLYPANLLYIFLPPFRAFNLSIVLHLIICIGFVYCFSRIIGFQPVSSFIAGIVYGFCGITLSLISFLNHFFALTLLPVLFLFWHLSLLEGKRRWFILTVIAGVIQTFAGSPELNAISLFSIMGWALFYPYIHRSIFRKIALWLLLTCLIAGIASVQIFPTLEMALYSSRGEGLGYKNFSQWSLYPKRLPEIVFPHFWGYADTLRDENYWGRDATGKQPMPFILSIYLGWVTGILAILGGLGKVKDSRMPFRVKRFLLILMGVSLLASFGDFLPFFRFLYQYFPVIRIFRYPSKFLIAGIFPVALLTGYTSELLFAPSPKKAWNASFPIKVVFWGIGLFLCALTTTFVCSRNFANYFQEVFFGESGGEIARQGLQSSFIHATVLWLALVLLYHYRQLKKSRWQHWIVAGIILVDLLAAGRRINPSAPEEFFTKVPASIETIRQEINNGRFFRDTTPPNFIVAAPAHSEDIVWFFRWYLETVDLYTAAFYKIPVIFHADHIGLKPKRLVRLHALMKKLPWERRLPLLSAGGVTLILSADDLAFPGIKRLAEIPNLSNIHFYLYRNKTAAAQVQFVPNWKKVDSDVEAIKTMLHPEYDPRTFVVLEEPDSPFPFSLLRKQAQPVHLPDHPLMQQNLNTCSPIHLTRIRANNHTSVFQISTPCDGYLVFSETFHPGWNVYVNGNQVSVLRANLAFSAVFLQAGEHTIERAYRPDSLVAGIFSSVVFCFAGGLVIYKRWC